MHRNPYIVLYDGDGGGMGAHIRHLAHIYYLCHRYGAEILLAHPALDACFIHPYRRPILIHEENSILIEDLFPTGNSLTNTSISEALRMCSENDLFILSGRHHGPIPWDFLPRRSSLRTRRLLECLFHDIRPKSHISAAPRLLAAGLNPSRPFISVHLRTFVDSENGYQRFCTLKKDIFETYVSLILQESLRIGVNDVFLASDSISDASQLCDELSELGLKAHLDYAGFVHSSTVKIFGLDVLVNCDNHQHQVAMANNNITADRGLFTYSEKTLELILALSHGESVVCSTSSIGPIACAFSKKRIPITFVPNTSTVFSINVVRDGPFA